MKKIAAILAGFVLTAGLALSLGSTAYAGTGNQFCNTVTPECLNAWGGGPWIKVETARGTANNDFTLGYDSTLGVYYLRFTGGGTWNNYCIGDANSDPNDARAAVGACPSGSNSGGWGTNFTLNTGSCPPGQEAFFNKHWQGYISSSAAVNGTQFYLNGGGLCFTTYNGA